MRRPALAGLGGLFVAALCALPGHAAPSDPLLNGQDAVAAKRRHLAEVCADLATRPMPELTTAQRTRRAAVLNALRRYAARGLFPQNTKLPGHQLPYFVDDAGTRCALAFGIDRTGGRALIARLLRTANHAYVAHLARDKDLGAWLRHNGLTLDEAAYIQAPGIIDDPDGRDDPADDVEPPTPTDTPSDTPSETPSDSPPPTVTPRGTTTRTRGSVDRGSWTQWWQRNRDAYANLRTRYHAGAVTVTGTPNGAHRGWRPTKGQFGRDIEPQLRRLANEKGEVRATAIMAWALAVRGERAREVVAHTLDYLRRPESRYRDLLVLALGIVRQHEATAALRELVRDTKRGRALLARSGGVPATTQAFAALALGASRDAAAVADLTALLGRRSVSANVQAAALAALGQLAPVLPAAAKTALATRLADELRRERLPDVVLAALPAALLRTGAAGQDALLRRLARFSGKRMIRAAGALALGVHAPLEARTIEVLIAAARRDPDVATRRFAALAVGEICTRHPGTIDDALAHRLRRFYRGTLDGHLKQPNAFSWHVLSAGLFVRKAGSAAGKVPSRLARLATTAKRDEVRAAALIALGLTKDRTHAAVVRKALKDARQPLLRGSAAEALGMLRDRTSRDTLRELATTDTAGTVRYQAAVALGHLADAGATQELVTALGQARSAAPRAALARVLGELGDRRSLPALLELAGDTRRARSVRERALGALGLILRVEPQSWTLSWRRGAHFAVAQGALATLFRIF